MKFERIKTSFKDPDGFVFNYDGNIYIDYNSWYKSDKEGIKTSDINKIFTFLQKIKPSIFFHVFLPSFLEKKEFISKEGINKKKFSIEKY